MPNLHGASPPSVLPGIESGLPFAPSPSQSQQRRPRPPILQVGFLPFPFLMTAWKTHVLKLALLLLIERYDWENWNRSWIEWSFGWIHAYDTVKVSNLWLIVLTLAALLFFIDVGKSKVGRLNGEWWKNNMGLFVWDPIGCMQSQVREDEWGLL